MTFLGSKLFLLFRFNPEFGGELSLLMGEVIAILDAEIMLLFVADVIGKEGNEDGDAFVELNEVVVELVCFKMSD